MDDISIHIGFNCIFCRFYLFVYNIYVYILYFYITKSKPLV